MGTSAEPMQAKEPLKWKARESSQACVFRFCVCFRSDTRFQTPGKSELLRERQESDSRGSQNGGSDKSEPLCNER